MFTQGNFSIERKLRWMMVATSAVALFLACVVFVLAGVNWYDRKIDHDLETMANLVGPYSQAALEFDDEEVAQEQMDFLEASPQIVAGFLYRTIANDEPEVDDIAPERMIRSDDTNSVSYLMASYLREGLEIEAPTKLPSEGHHSEVLGYSTTILNLEDSPVGTVYLVFDHRLKTRFFGLA